MPKVIYDALWSTATWGAEVRQADFEAAFSLIMLSIDEIEFVTTLNWSWFVAYDAAVEAGDAPLAEPCPCDSF